MKKCPRCKEHLDLTLFASHTYRKDGKQAWCKQCFSEHKKRIRMLATIKQIAHEADNRYLCSQNVKTS